MECIICQDIGAEPLQDNTSCTCKYKVHNSCWIDYVNSKTNVTCLLCRKERVESKNEISSSPTIILPLPTIIEEQEQIQEQESQNTINSVQTQGSLWQTQGSLWQIPVITNKEMYIKIIKIAICIVILVLVFVLIWT